MTSFAPVSGPSIPTIGTCDGGGIVARPKTPKYACDGGGFVAKVEIPKGAMTMTGDARDVVGTSRSAQTGGAFSGKKGVIAATILLVGGALLGYGHKEQISKGLNNLKGSVDKFFSTGKPAEWLKTGTEWLNKAKDAIMSK